ncbi:zinc finger protein [Macleaya cordata]|uniref:Zinc finger protein n=1 Tax=Macleaya cordata TaxID=56857 RepID=A0A200PQA9_MACCD|nr:zinc finger protein [Macleaya cordata]
MPVQKRSSENLEDDSQQRHRHYQQQQKHQQVHHGNDEVENEEAAEAEEQEQEQDEGDNDSDRSPSSSGDDNDEYLFVKLSDIRKEVQCPICLGIIRKTRTVMECLHRFCRECIDKSMRLGNNECPACRTHCASRRSLRDDPNYDALIATLYPDIDKYEEKELAFSDEEKTRNKHIQASIAQTFQRQSEALGRRRTTAKSVTSFTRRSQGNCRRGRRRNNQATKIQGSEDDEDGNGDSNGNGGGIGSSSTDEQCAGVNKKRCRRRAGRCSSQPSSASANASVGCNENNGSEVNKESTAASPWVVGTPEVLVWGRGGTRSHTRYGSVSGGNSKNTKSNRLFKLVNYLRSLEENDAGGIKEDPVK